MPAPWKPPVAVTVPFVMFTVPATVFKPPPMPAPLVPAVATRAPVPPIVKAASSVTFKAATFAPPLKTLEPASVKPTVVPDAISKAGRPVTEELSMESESAVTSQDAFALQRNPLAVPPTVNGPALSRERIFSLRE